MDRHQARELLIGCFDAALAAVDPEQAVAANLVSSTAAGRLVVLALGKAAPAMARGAAVALGAEQLEGIVVSNHEDAVPAGIEFMIGSHPIPDQRSVEAGEALFELAASLDEDDLAIVLISGGGSALAEVPVPGVTIADLARANEVLLRSGADIIDTNVVRRRLSRFKGGGLAAAISPARIVTLVISDVVGDALVAIASGPTVAAADAEGAAWEVIERLGVRELLPPSVVAALRRTAQDPGPLPQQQIKVVASGPVAAHAAAAEAQRRGFPATVMDTRIAGEASVTAGEVLSRSPGSVSVFAGETTVNVTGDGMGGRNHEAALAAAVIIDGDSHVFFLAAGTDGLDGMAEAAGAFADGTTVTRARAQGLNADDSLERNDSGAFFAATGDRLVIGPTGTNVGDIWLVLRTD